jgi:hypothetical protein
LPAVAQAHQEFAERETSAVSLAPTAGDEVEVRVSKA